MWSLGQPLPRGKPWVGTEWRQMSHLWRRRLVSAHWLRRTLDELAAQGRNGVRVMRELLDERGDDYVPGGSNLGHRFDVVLERAGEPAMRRQVDSGGDRWIGRVDFRDEQRPLTAEGQSEMSLGVDDKRDDEQRLSSLRAAGFEVVEVTDNQVWYHPDEVVEAVVRRVGGSVASSVVFAGMVAPAAKSANKRVTCRRERVRRGRARRSRSRPGRCRRSSPRCRPPATGRSPPARPGVRPWPARRARRRRP